MNAASEVSGDTPLVSIIIPVFNGARYVAEAIDSALAQSYQNLEVIVVDDGSDDGGATAAICEDYGDQIRYFRKPNGGVASALNFGIARMSGSYFWWLSHDDRYLPDKVRRQVDMVIGSSEPMVVFGDAYVIDPEGRRRFLTRLGEGWRSAFDARWLALEGRLSGCTLLVPRVCFAQCGGFDESRPTVQDLELWYRIGTRYRFVFCPEVLVESRVHPEQGSKIDWHLDEAALTLIDLFKRAMRDGGPLTGADVPGTATYRFWRHHLRCSYSGLRRFCERLRLEGRQSCSIVLVDAGGGSTGRVAATLVDAGFRDVAIVGRAFAPSGDTAPPTTATPGATGPLITATGHDLFRDLAELEGDEIVVLGFGDGAALESLAGEMDRVIGREADAVIWAPGVGTGLRLAARAGALRAALDRLAGGDLTGLPQELAMVGSLALCHAPVPPAEIAAKASREISEAASPEAEPRGAAASSPATEVTPAQAAAGPEAAAERPGTGPVPLILAESRPRAGTERLRRVLSTPPLGRAIQGLARGLHRHGPGRLSRRAVSGVEWIYCVRGRIDPSWYITRYPEVRAAGWHPSLHYLAIGWREGKDPSPHFSTALNAAYLTAPGHLNPLTRSALAGRSFAPGFHAGVPLSSVPPAAGIETRAPPAPAAAAAAEDGVAAAPATVPALPAAEPGRRAILIVSDGSADAAAWSRALAQAARRRAPVWRATLRDGAISDAVDASGHRLDLTAAGAVKAGGGSVALDAVVDRITFIGSVRAADVGKLLSSGPVPYGMLPLRLSDVEDGSDVLRRAARVFAPSQSAKRFIDERMKGDAVLLRPPDFAAAVRFPVSALDTRPGETLRVLAVSGTASSVEVISVVARRLGRERVEITGAGPAPAETAVRRSLPWYPEAPMVDLVGALDPHLVWFHGDLDFCPPFALVDVLRMGRPTIISGASANGEGLAGRALTWTMTDRDPSAVSALLAGLAAGSAPVPEGGDSPEDAGLGRLPIEKILA